MKRVQSVGKRKLHQRRVQPFCQVLTNKKKHIEMSPLHRYSLPMLRSETRHGLSGNDNKGLGQELKDPTGWHRWAQAMT